MNSFNNIVKVKYKNETSEPVTLSEYIIFEDERYQEKYLVFKFRNNLAQTLKEIRVEITAYDNNENIIEKFTLNYDKLSAYDNEDFVPNAKLKVKYECKSISAKLLFARFDRVIWVEGNYEPIQYTADNFKEDFGKDKKKEEKKLIKEKKTDKKRAKRKVLVHSVMNATKSRSVKVWGIIFSVVVLAYFITTAIIFKNSSSKFADAKYDYQILNKEEAAVIGYYGKGKNPVIPEKSNGYKITQISNKVFEGKKIDSITFTSDISIDSDSFLDSTLAEIHGSEFVTYIGQGAFKNTLLTDAYFMNVTEISSFAFENCSSLKNVYAPQAYIDECAFLNDTVSNLEFDDTAASSLYRLFSVDDMNAASCVTSVDTGMTYISASFFANCSGITSITFANEEELTVEYPAFIDTKLYGYDYTDNAEYLEGKMISSANSGTLYLDSHTASFDDVLVGDNSKVTKIVITNPSYRVTNTMLSNFPNLNTLEIENLETIAPLDPISSTKIRTLKINNNSNYIYTNYIKAETLRNVTKLEINGTGKLTTENMKNFLRVSSLTIGSGITSVEDGAFDSFRSLATLSIPVVKGSDLKNTTLKTIGVPDSITKLILSKGAYSYVSENYVNNYSLLADITIDSSYKTIYTNAFAYLPLVSYLEFPYALNALSEGCIGEGMTSLSSVKIPFVGTKSTSGISYEKLNLSAKYTKNLTIVSSMTASSDFSNGLENCIALTFIGKVTYSGSAFLSNASKLEYLDMSYLSVSDVNAAFKNEIPSSLYTLVLRDSDASNVISLLSKSSVRELFLIDSKSIDANNLNSTSLYKVYMDSKSITADWDTSLAKVYSLYLYFSGDLPEGLDGYSLYRTNFAEDELSTVSTNYEKYNK